MGDAFKLKIINKIDTKKLENLAKKKLHILVGYPAGEVNIGGIDSADLAKRLVTGNLGQKKQGWNFLLEGVRDSKQQVIQLLRLHMQSKIDSKSVGEFGATSVKNFVKKGSYIGSRPNERQYLFRKAKQHGELRPLIIKGDFIDACTYKIKDKG